MTTKKGNEVTRKGGGSLLGGQLFAEAHSFALADHEDPAVKLKADSGVSVYIYTS